jgi:hypothetical protein
MNINKETENNSWRVMINILPRVIDNYGLYLVFTVQDEIVISNLISMSLGEFLNEY